MLEIHERNHLRILSGMKENQVLHLSLCSLYAIFIETVHEIQSMSGDLLDFISSFHDEKLRKQCIIHEKRYALRNFLQDIMN